MRFATRDEELEELFDPFAGQTTKRLAFLEWQLEQGAAQVVEQDEQVVGVDQRLLG